MTEQQQQLKTAINLLRFKLIDTDGISITKNQFKLSPSSLAFQLT